MRDMVQVSCFNYNFLLQKGTGSMGRRRARIHSIAAVIMVLFGLAGCGHKGTEELVPFENVSSTDSPKTKLVFLRVGIEPERKKYWEEAIAAFMMENPDIEIEYQECGYGDDFETKLNIGFASGTAPDVINFTMASMGTRVPLGQYASLNEYVNDWEGKEDFMKNALELGRVRDNIYGIAVYSDPRILIYNKELFKQAGLDPEQPPKNWQELLDCHKKLIKKEGDTVIQTGFGIPTSGRNLQHYFSVFMEEHGMTNLVDEDNNELLCNTPEAIEAAEFLKQIAEEGIIHWDSDHKEQNPFARGQAAMTLGNTLDFHNWNQGAMEGKLAMAVPLTNREQRTFCGMSFLFMSGETEHEEEAWKFIEFISSSEQMWKRYEELGIPPLRESLKKQFIERSPENNEAIYASINYGTGSPKVAYANSVYNAINDALEKIIYGVEDAKTALDTAAEVIQQEIDNQ